MAAIEIETDPSALKHERVMPSTSDSSSASYDCESHRYVRAEGEGWRGSQRARDGNPATNVPPALVVAGYSLCLSVVLIIEHKVATSLPPSC